MDISVIICAHNPRQDYLHRVLKGLEQQTLSKERWELLLIDNASADSLALNYDLSWHRRARHVFEKKVGVTFARRRGINEAEGELLIFVDDDNVLSEDYLAAALKIAGSHPWVGAFGGSTLGEFEHQPGDEIQFMLPQLAVREITSTEWGLLSGLRSASCAPYGAGMVIRRKIAMSYVEKTKADSFRRHLGRAGSSLMAGEDTDLALFSTLANLAVGRFPELVLTHLIPKERLERDYLIRLAEGMTQSHVILYYLWNGRLPEQKGAVGKAERLIAAYRNFVKRLRGNPDPSFQELIWEAQRRGGQKARCMVIDYESSSR